MHQLLQKLLLRSRLLAPHVKTRNIGSKFIRKIHRLRLLVIQLGGRARDRRKQNLKEYCISICVVDKIVLTSILRHHGSYLVVASIALLALSPSSSSTDSTRLTDSLSSSTLLFALTSSREPARKTGGGCAPVEGDDGLSFFDDVMYCCTAVQKASIRRRHRLFGLRSTVVIIFFRIDRVRE